jgi:hypothetical protein
MTMRSGMMNEKVENESDIGISNASGDTEESPSISMVSARSKTNRSSTVWSYAIASHSCRLESFVHNERTTTFLAIEILNIYIRTIYLLSRKCIYFWYISLLGPTSQVSPFVQKLLCWRSCSCAICQYKSLRTKEAG